MRVCEVGDLGEGAGRQSPFNKVPDIGTLGVTGALVPCYGRKLAYHFFPTMTTLCHRFGPLLLPRNSLIRSASYRIRLSKGPGLKTYTASGNWIWPEVLVKRWHYHQSYRLGASEALAGATSYYTTRFENTTTAYQHCKVTRWLRRLRTSPKHWSHLVSLRQRQRGYS
jgi:hypothetical protein